MVRIGGMTRQEFLRLVAGGSLTWPSAVHARAERDAEQPAPRSFPSGATKAVVEFISGATLSGMPERAIVEAKRCLIDGFGVVLAGATTHGSAIVREYITSGAGAKEATVLGPARLSATAAQAALANGASGHAMDYDDTQLSATADRVFGLLTHPTVPALAASLAVAERLGASGAVFLEAFLTGFEVECKIAEAIDPVALSARLSHLWDDRHVRRRGKRGQTAEAGRPPRRRMRSASRRAWRRGIRVNFGSMTKPLHVGRAAENGVFAAELASRGFHGGRRRLDGQWGYFQVLGGGADCDGSSRLLGKPYSIVDPASRSSRTLRIARPSDDGRDAEAGDG